MNFDVNDLPASVSHYDGHNTLYYRGDGVNTAVSVPEGKTIVLIDPDCLYIERVDGLVVFGNAIPNGELVKIHLKDSD